MNFAIIQTQPDVHEQCLQTAGLPNGQRVNRDLST